jgi:type IV pilus assembly protein PilQ|tara:strand:- start:191 stop:1867 length:1677 start_codon:yes stop_codon:yes gene_type:complete
MNINFQHPLLKFQTIAVFLILIMLVACTEPYTVPKKGENEKNTRVIFEEDIEKEKNIQGDEQIIEIVKNQKAKVERLAQFGPTREISNKNLSLNRKKIINTSEPNTPVLASLNTDLYESFPVTLSFINTDIREVMQVFSEITNRNILVGKEVQAILNIELRDIPWKIALKSILDIEGLTWAIDNKTGLIRIHGKDILREQITYDKERLQTLNDQLDYQANLVPKSTAVFQLYYIKAETMLKRLNEALLGGQAGEGETAASTISSIKLMAEPNQNTIIANGTEEDLIFVEKIINEVDLPVEQVLIEAIIVKATDTFQEELGARLGGAVDIASFKQDTKNEQLRDLRGVQVGPGQANSGDVSTQAFATVANTDAYNQDRITDFAIANPTLGLGIIADIGFAQIKGEIFTMQSEGLTKTIDNPKVFVLDNQEAKITSGTQIAYIGSGDNAGVELVDAALELTVTPQIVGDGNILIILSVSNNSPSGSGSNPPISTLEIDTSLIVKDGDVVVIGGVFSNTESQSESKVPILGDIPFLGRLFRSDAKVDNQEQVLIFIAPKVV